MKIFILTLFWSLSALAQTNSSPESLRERVSDYETAKAAMDRAARECDTADHLAVSRECVIKNLNLARASLQCPFLDQPALKKEFAQFSDNLKYCAVLGTEKNGAYDYQCLVKRADKLSASLQDLATQTRGQVSSLKDQDPVAKNQALIDEMASLDASIAIQQKQLNSLKRNLASCEQPSSGVSNNTVKPVAPNAPAAAPPAMKEDEIVLPGQDATRARR